MTSPNTTEYLAASEEAYSGVAVTGLTPLLNADGTAVIGEIDGDGFYAAAYMDTSGNVIIAYRGTVFDTSIYGLSSAAADALIFAQKDPQAFNDAENFFVTVQARVNQIAQQNKTAPAPIYLTGHSLGGGEAEYVAEVSGFTIGGMVFGAPGLPAYTNSTPPTNFVSYVDYGDPVGNFASDVTGELGFAPANGMDHVGKVITLGAPSSGDNLAIASIAFDKALPGSFLDTLPTALKLFLWPVDLPYAAIGLFGNLDNHSLGEYAQNLNLTVPGLTTLNTTESLYEILVGLDAPLGAAGQADLQQATISLAGATAQSPLFTVSISADGSIVTVDQRQAIQNASGSLVADPGTLVVDVGQSSGSQAATFTDATTGMNENLLFSSSDGVLDTETTDNSDGTSNITTFDYTNSGDPFYTTNTYTGTNGAGRLVSTIATEDDGTSDATYYSAGGSSDQISYSGSDGSGPATGSDILVANGDSLDASATTSDETVTFLGTATLGMPNPTAFSGIVYGFLPGDTIDLAGVGTATSATLGTGNVLTVLAPGGTINLTLDPSQDYSIDAFHVAPDSNGGTNITVSQKPGYYIPQPGDTLQSIAAKFFDIDAATLARVNAVFSDSSFNAGGLVHTPIALINGVDTLPPLPQDQTYVFDPTKDITYTVGSSLDGHDSGALIIDQPDFAGNFPAFAAGTYSGVSLQANDTVDVTLISGNSAALGTLAISPSGSLFTLTDGETIQVAPTSGALLTNSVGADATPEQVLASYLTQLGAPESIASLDQANTAYLAEASKPAATTYTFANGHSITLNQGAYSTAGLVTFPTTTFNASLTTAQGEIIGTLALNPTTGAGTLTDLDGSTYNISGDTSLQLTAPSANDTPLQVLTTYINELGAVSPPQPVYTPYVLSPEIGLDVFGSPFEPPGSVVVGFNDFGGKLEPGAIVNGLSTVTLSGIQRPAYNILYTDTNSNLSSDTLTNIQELNLAFSGTTVISGAQYNELQAITVDSPAIGIGFSDPGSYSYDSRELDGILSLAAESQDGTTLVGSNIVSRVTLYASTYGTDTLVGGSASDTTLQAGAGDDTLIAGNGANQDLVAGAGVDTLIGGTGGDAFVVNTPAAGSVIQGAGTNNTLYAAGDISKISVSGIQTLSTVLQGGGAITLTAEQLAGFSSVVGGGTITASGAGTFSIAGKSNYIFNMTATDWGGTALVDDDAASETLTASLFGNDTLIAGDGAGDKLVAGEGVDTLVGGNGGDTFVANDGLADGSVIAGGSGANILQGSDDITLATISGVQTLQTNSITLTAAQFNGFTSIERVTSSPFSNPGTGIIDAATAGTYSLVGKGASPFNMSAESNGGTALIANDANNETLTASASGDDGLTVGNGSNDTLDAINTSGNDTLTAGNGSGDILNATGSTGNDTLSGGNGGDTLHAGYGSDQMYGGTGNDSFYLGTGNAYVQGNGGNDTYFVTSAGDNQIVINNFHADSGVSTLDLTNTFAGNVIASRSGNDLVLTIGADPITVQNYFSGSDYQLSEIKFQLGTEWNYPTVLSMVSNNSGTPPTVSATIDNTDVNVGNPTGTVTFTFSTAPADFSLADVSAVGGTVGGLSGSGTTYTATFTGATGTDINNASVSVATGTYHDANGNAGIGGGTLPFTVDSVTPTVAVAIDTTDVNVANPTGTVTFTFSTAPADFSLADVTSSDGTLSNLSGAGTAYTATFTASAGVDDAQAMVSVASGSYHDANGNAGTGGSTAPFTVDTVTPTVAVAIDNTDVDVASPTGTVTFTFGTAPTNFSLADVTAVGGTLSNLTGSGESYTATFTGATNTDIDTASISVAAGSYDDASGNAGTAGSTAPFTVDTVTGGATGGGNGDVHLTTFDNLAYDFQALGEFTLVKATNGESLDVQVRLQPYYGSTTASVITAAALQIGSDRVTFDINGQNPILVDGQAAALSATQPIELAGGTIFQTASNDYEVAHDTGEVVTLQQESWGFNVNVSLGPNHAQDTVEGLLGTDSGNAANDLTLPDGTILAQPVASAILYSTYADAWRVTEATSLFDYAPGQSTATYTDTTFPLAAISVDPLFTTNADGSLSIDGTSSSSDPDLADLAGQTVTATLNGNTYSGTIQNDGSWSVNVGSAGAASLVGGQAYAVTATVTDQDGDTARDVASVTLDAAASGQSSLTVANGATLEVGAASAQNVAFLGNAGTLQLDASTLFTGSISGFAGQDAIDLSDIAFGSQTTIGYAANSTNTGGMLTASDGTRTASFALLGQYVAADFADASDGHGGTIIAEPSLAALIQPNLAMAHA